MNNINFKLKENINHSCCYILKLKYSSTSSTEIMLDSRAISYDDLITLRKCINVIADIFNKNNSINSFKIKLSEKEINIKLKRDNIVEFDSITYFDYIGTEYEVIYED